MLKRRMAQVLGGFGLLTALPVQPGAVAGLTLEQRVEAQRSIEQVYWNHRIWPQENPGPKPPLSAVMPDEKLQGFWHLVRANFPGGPGTYDETSPKQVGLRDAEISASPAACP